MKVLLIGASGMLGFALHRSLHDSGVNVTGSVRSAIAANASWTHGLVYTTGVHIENFDTVEGAVNRHQPDVVINATGARSLGSVNGDWATLLAVNSIFPRQLGQLCDSLGIHFIHFSSDGVFSGARGNYSESARPDAPDAYGVSKYLGEVQTATALVLRTSMLGRGIVRGKSLADWYLAQSGSVRGYRYVVFSGLPVTEIANVLQRILAAPSPLTGLCHLAAAPISKFEALTLLRSAWAHAADIEPDDSLKIDRSLDGTLLCSKIDYRPPPWPQMIAEMHDFYEGLESK